ncbi:MAG: hypothetical protein JNK64_12725 [Myxococcales bacterium]|nr:hypothetical protein [Myxococcales bacterium]
MAKRPPRQELRVPTARAPYRRARTTTAPPALDLPMPPPAAAPPVAEVAPAAAPPVAEVAKVAPAAPPVVAPAPVAVIAPPPPVAPLAAVALPDLVAITQSALGFATAALAVLPEPDALVHRDPAAAEPPPGRAPRADARSLRSDSQFALIYRSGATLVSRRGKLGEHGVWRTVAYPGAAQAAHAFALECSRLIEQGFRDVA